QRFLLRLASFHCCHSHHFGARFQSNDFRMIARHLAAFAHKISRSCVVILIACVMHSFADRSMHFSSPPRQIADFISSMPSPHAAFRNSPALARGLPLRAASGPEMQQTGNDGASDEVMYDSASGSSYLRDFLADRSLP